MAPKICPKCSSPMQPGFPVETASKGGSFVTRWSDQLPVEVAGLFGGHTFARRDRPNEFLMGFACVECGYVELYKVSDEQMRQTLQAAAAPPS